MHIDYQTSRILQEDTIGVQLENSNLTGNLSDEEFETTLHQARELIHNAAQPLTTILNLCEMLACSKETDPNLNDDLNLILDQAMLLRGIFRTLSYKLH